MITIGLIFTGIAAAIHVYIFALESLLWRTPRARAVFGTSVEEAEVTASLALNQGFYNLFLAVIIAIGTVALGLDHRSVGAALVLSAAGSMVAVSAVLAISSPDKLRPAAIQGLPPLLGCVLVSLAL